MRGSSGSLWRSQSLSLLHGPPLCGKSGALAAFPPPGGQGMGWAGQGVSRSTCRVGASVERAEGGKEWGWSTLLRREACRGWAWGEGGAAAGPGGEAPSFCLELGPDPEVCWGRGSSQLPLRLQREGVPGVPSSVLNPGGVQEGSLSHAGEISKFSDGGSIEVSGIISPSEGTCFPHSCLSDGCLRGRGPFRGLEPAPDQKGQAGWGAQLLPAPLVFVALPGGALPGALPSSCGCSAGPFCLPGCRG